MQHSRRTKNAAPKRRPVTRRRSQARPGGELVAASIYLSIVSLFGGGLVEWSLPNILLILATIGFVLFVSWRDGFAALSRAPRTGQVALAGIAALPLLQLVPLPPALWQALPGQELRRATLDLVGMTGTWQPLTLEPVSTALCAVLAIGFVCFTGLLLRLSDADFRRLLVAVFALVALGMVAGLLQVVSDGQYLTFFNPPQGGTLLGFFANKNHMALAVACSILLFAFLVGRDGLVPSRRLLLVGGYTLFALICIVTTNSRAGLGLGMLAAAFVFADLTRGVALRWRLAALAGIAVLAVSIATSSAFELVLGRIDDTGDDLRWRFTTWSWPLVKRYAALGSGVGSFRTVYQAQEQLDHVIPTFVNAVHDDYLQLVLEAGVPGMLVLLLLLLSLIGGLIVLRRSSQRDPRRRVMVFGLLVLLLFAMHSALDYPLRRPAAWVLLAVALASVYRAMPRARLPESHLQTTGEAA